MNIIKINFLALSMILFFGQSLIAMEKQEDRQLTENNNSEFECCSCLEEINPNQSDDIAVFNCNHYLCNTCFEDWQQRGNTCPQCREPIVRAYRTFKDILAQEELKNAYKQILKLQNDLKRESAFAQKIRQKINEYSEIEDQMQLLTLENDQLKARLEQQPEKEKEEVIPSASNEVQAQRPPFSAYPLYVGVQLAQPNMYPHLYYHQNVYPQHPMHTYSNQTPNVYNPVLPQ